MPLFRIHSHKWTFQWNSPGPSSSMTRIGDRDALSAAAWRRAKINFDSVVSTPEYYSIIGPQEVLPTVKSVARGVLGFNPTSPKIFYDYT